MATQKPEQATPPAPATGVPADGNALRGYHFKRLMGKTLTLVLGGIFFLGAGLAAAIAAGPVAGLAALVVAALVVVLVVFAIADSKAEDAFFDVYARERGLSLTGKQTLPGATPLLRKGDDRYAERTLTGNLAEDCAGMLALYTYEEESTDSQGHRQTSYYRYTITLSEIPECAGSLPKLRVHRKSGLRALQGLEDSFRKDERVELESEALSEKFEIFAGQGVDANWLRQLFSPSFILWLTERAPQKFAFEVSGTLCCFANGHKENAAELDGMRAGGATVSRRLREEALETPVAT